MEKHNKILGQIGRLALYLMCCLIQVRRRPHPRQDGGHAVRQGHHESGQCAQGLQLHLPDGPGALARPALMVWLRHLLRRGPGMNQGSGTV